MTRGDDQEEGTATAGSARLNDWQLQELQNAVREADAGDFADEAEVAATFSRWGVDQQKR